jgi:hypothetical protein
MPLLQIETYHDADDQAYQIWANYIDSIQLRVVGQKIFSSPFSKRWRISIPISLCAK